MTIYFDILFRSGFRNRPTRKNNRLFYREKSVRKVLFISVCNADMLNIRVQHVDSLN